jgi:hypothetical protein
MMLTQRSWQHCTLLVLLLHDASEQQYVEDQGKQQMAVKYQKFQQHEQQLMMITASVPQTSGQD